MMTAHHIKIFFRSFRRLLLYNLLNIISLALGLSCVLYIYSYVRFESSFDKFHSDIGNIYRVVFSEDRSYHSGSTLTPMVLSDIAKESYGNATFARLNNAGGARVNLIRGENKFQESRFYFTDSTFFNIFSFDLLEGNPKSCLTEPFTMVISQTASRKYFGALPPLNESIEIEWGPNTYQVRITGIIKDVPVNSHLQFDFLVSHATAQRIFSPPSFFTDWTANFCYTYVKLPDQLNSDVVERKLNQLFESNLKSKPDLQAMLQPVGDIHLHSDLKSEVSKNSKQSLVYFAIIIGIIILLITVVNFNSLYTSIYEQKIKSVAIQKVLGANSSTLFLQSLAELSFITILATGISILLLRSGLFQFNIDSANPLDSLLSHSWEVAYGLVFVFMILVLLIALPARAVSQTNPLVLFKSGFIKVGGISLRNMFMGIQFIISISLIAVYLLVNQQLEFVKNATIGFEVNDQIIAPQGRSIRNRSESIKAELRKVAGVKEITLSSNIPTGNLNLMIDSYPEGRDEKFPIAAVSVDFDFFNTYDINVVEGRTFSATYLTDSIQGIVINKATVKELGWLEPIGKTIRLAFNAGDGSFEKREGVVIGVVEDIHFESMHRQVKPLIYFCKPFWFYYVTIHLDNQISQGSKDKLAATWNKLVPEAPLDYTLLEDRYQKMYAQEKNWSSIIQKFVMLSVLLTLGGVFGMISFLLFKSRHEIVIRKIHGAGLPDVLTKFNMGVLKIFGLSLVFSIPLIILLDQSITSSLYYRAPISIIDFAAGFGTFLFLSLLLASFRIYVGFNSCTIDKLND